MTRACNNAAALGPRLARPERAGRRRLRPLRHAPGRTLLAVLAIALGVALGFAIYLINRVAADEVQGASRSLFGLADLAVQAPGAGFDEKLFPKLARLPGIAAASPVVEMRVRLPGRNTSLKVIGIDPFRAAQMQPALAGWRRCANRDGQGLLERKLRLAESGRRADARAASRRRTHHPGRARSRQPARRGAAAARRIPSARRDDGYRHGAMALASARADRSGRPATRARCESRRPCADRRELPPGVQVVTPGEATDDAVRLTRAYRSNLTALALVALFTGGSSFTPRSRWRSRAVAASSRCCTRWA